MASANEVYIDALNPVSQASWGSLAAVLRELPDCQKIKYLVRKAQKAGFNDLDDAFISQIKLFPTKNKTGAIAIQTIVKSSMTEDVRKHLKKPSGFEFFVLE